MNHWFDMWHLFCNSLLLLTFLVYLHWYVFSTVVSVDSSKFLCCSSSLFATQWFYMWYLFLSFPSFCALGRLCFVVLASHICLQYIGFCRLFQGGSSVAVLLCSCVSGFICGICFVVVFYLFIFFCALRWLCFVSVAFPQYIHFYVFNAIVSINFSMVVPLLQFFSWVSDFICLFCHFLLLCLGKTLLCTIYVTALWLRGLASWLWHFLGIFTYMSLVHWFLLTVPRRFLCCNFSLFVSYWFDMWHLFCYSFHLLFLCRSSSLLACQWFYM